MKNMKTILSLLLALLLLAGCGATANQSREEPIPETANQEVAEQATTETTDARPDVIVFAAASLTETLEAIKPVYEQTHNVNLVYSFESSGTLKEQIAQGAECDLFISAGQRQMDQLDAAADPEVNTEGLDCILSESRGNLLENKVTLCVPEGNPKGIDSFDKLAEALQQGGILLAMGNSDVPVGQYTQKILDYYGLDEETLAQAGEITYGSNVKEVTTWVSEGSVDCGVIYCTDAYSAGLEIVDEATAQMCGQVIYPAAVVKTGNNRDGALTFLDYLHTEEAMAVFQEVGFSPVN